MTPVPHRPKGHHRPRPSPAPAHHSAPRLTALGHLVAGMGVVLAVVVGTAAPASAHAQLQSTQPAQGSTLDRSPGQVVLHFGEPVEVSFGSVRVFNAAAQRTDTGRAVHPGGDSHAVAMAVPGTLAPGGYVVTWRVISADSHPVHGAFTFQIGLRGSGPVASGSLGGEASKLLSAHGGSAVVGVASGVARFLSFASLAVLIGGGLFAVVIWPGAREDRRARRLLWWALGVAAGSTVAGFALQGPYGGGLGLGAAADPSLLAAVWHTRFGQVYAARALLLALAAAVLSRLLRRPAGERVPPALLVAGAALGTTLLATPGLAGHAAVGSLVLVALPLDVVHLGAAAVWVGGLVLLTGAVIPASRGDHAGPGSPLRTAGPRFSQWALASVVTIAISGAFAAWRQVGTWGAVTTTPFGRLLLVKTAAFAVLVVLAAASRTTVHGHLAVPGTGQWRHSDDLHRPAAVAASGRGAVGAGSDAAARSGARTTLGAGSDARARSRLRTTVGAEVGIAAAVLGITAVLVASQPARADYATPFSTEVHAGADLVDVTVDPAKAGPLTVHLYVLSSEGAQLDVPEVLATLSLPTSGIDPITVPLHRAGPGHFSAYGLDVPIRGAWRLEVRVRTTDIDELAADPITVHIR